MSSCSSGWTVSLERLSRSTGEIYFKMWKCKNVVSLTMDGESRMNWEGDTVVEIHSLELCTHLLSREPSMHCDLREHLFSTVHQPHRGNESSAVHSSHVEFSEHVSRG